MASAWLASTRAVGSTDRKCPPFFLVFFLSLRILKICLIDGEIRRKLLKTNNVAGTQYSTDGIIHISRHLNLPMADRLFCF